MLFLHLKIFLHLDRHYIVPHGFFFIADPTLAYTVHFDMY